MPLPSLITTADTFNTWFDATNNLISHVANTSVYVQANANTTGNVNISGTIQTTNLTVTGSANLASVSLSGLTTLANVAVTNAASLANTLSVTGLTTFGANVGIGNTAPTHRLRVDGTSSFNGAVNALSTVGVSGTLNALAAFGVTGATTLTGAVNALSTVGVTGTLNALGAFGVAGTTAFAGAVNALSTVGVTGTLNALGALGVSGAFSALSTAAVTGTATFAANVNFDSGTLFVDATNNRIGVGNTSPAHALRVEGTTSISGALNALSTMSVSGAVNALSTLGVTGATTLSSTLAVTAAATLSNTLAVTGTTTLSNTLAVAGHITAQTGVVYLNAGQTRYVQFDGSQYLLPGAQLLVNGQTVLNAGNYNSYAPTLTGTGASGSWNINAYPRRSDGAAITLAYNGLAGQPNWTFGTNDGTTFNVYNPANFTVSHATTAGNITAYTINQSLGTGNSPQFNSLILTNGNFSAVNWDQAVPVGGRTANLGTSAPVNGGPVGWLKLTVGGVDVCFPVWGPV